MSAAATSDTSAKILPFFVYGTLMKGFENNTHVLRGRGDGYQRCQMKGAVICHFEVGYPGLYETEYEEDMVWGELIHVKEDVYATVLAELDRLEDYDETSSENLYLREIRTVLTEAGEAVEAYVYVCQIDPAQTPSVAIASPGDWRAYLESAQKEAFRKSTDTLPL